MFLYLVTDIVQVNHHFHFGTSLITAIYIPIFFQGMPPHVRLDPSDAELVDVIHTDGKGIIFLGTSSTKLIKSLYFSTCRLRHVTAMWSPRFLSKRWKRTTWMWYYSDSFGTVNVDKVKNCRWYSTQISKCIGIRLLYSRNFQRWFGRSFESSCRL